MPYNYPQNPKQNVEQVDSTQIPQPKFGPETKKPGMFESFMAGYKNPHLTAEQWADSRLTPEEWMQKYPQANMRDYKKWVRSLKMENRNWLQKLFLPKSVMRNLRNIN